MAINNNKILLSEDFLMDLYFTCFHKEYIAAIVSEHISKEMLPDKDFQAVHTALCDYHRKNNSIPQISIIKQSLISSKSACMLLNDIADTGSELSEKDVTNYIEQYIKQVKFKDAIAKAGNFFNSGAIDKGMEVVSEWADWAHQFSLQLSEFLDVASDFMLRYKRNLDRKNDMTHRVPVTRFYIDQLDSLNGGRDLRGQLTCFLACTGIGKSHIARYVGKQACMMDGLDVLHVQLEGSESEVFNAYSASFIQRSTFDYENCKFTAEQLKEFEDQLKAVAGSVKIKAYTKFACDVSTRDVRNTIQEYIKFYGKTPDVVIIDSMDLLTDSSGRHYTEKGERLKRISVANDLKDMASDIDAWFIVTYQATFENKDWLDDEKNVLSAENIAEAKGIARPVTHLITLNQSSQERQDATMRLFVAKARFWKPSKVFKIATDYQNEQFYDRQRSITLAMTQ